MAEYSREEAEEILRRAAEQDAGDGVSHEDLLAAASEVGIDASSLEAAAAELAKERESGARDIAIRKVLRADFSQSLTRFVGINALVLAINVLTGGAWWFYWVTLGTGIFLFGTAVRNFMPGERQLLKASNKLDKRERRQRRKLEREARKQAYRERKSGGGDQKSGRSGAEAEFERVVEAGVQALLRSAADRIEDFNAKERGPRVRVEVGDRHDSGEPERLSSEDRSWHGSTRRRRR